MNDAFWKSDWFVGASISFISLIAWWWGSAMLESLERDAYDFGVLSASRDPGAKAQVAIDDKSIQNIGRWPWSREIHTGMIEKLQGAGAKTIGNTIFYFEPQVAAGLEWLARFREGTRQLADQGASVENLLNLYDAAELEMDTDRILAESMIRAGNVVLGMQFVPGEPIGNPDEEMSDYVIRNAVREENISDVSGQSPRPRPTVLAVPPIPSIGEPAQAIGHLINPLDVDGGIRFEPLVIDYYGGLYPSQSLLIAAASHRFGPGDIKVNLGDSGQLGNLTIKTDPFLQLNTFSTDAGTAIGRRSMCTRSMTYSRTRFRWGTSRTKSS